MGIASKSKHDFHVKKMRQRCNSVNDASANKKRGWNFFQPRLNFTGRVSVALTGRRSAAFLPF
jgi:hypothetical protein